MPSLGSYPPLKMGSVPMLSLGSTGRSIPQLGYGTADFPFGDNSETMKESILHAIRIGYRQFDTAANYQSEQPLGEAIAEALRLGFIQSRDELFITSKLWCSDAHPNLVLPALRNSLGSIGVDYLDLYLIHFPVSMKPGPFEYPFKDILPMDFKAVWEKMEEGQRIGLTKSIGVSNFSCKKLENLLATAKIPPAVNQVEMNPKWQQKKLRELCDRENILIVAYSPLGARGTPWQANLVTECEVLKEIATANGKTVAQVCLRWLCEQGVGVVVKSFNKERIKENFDIFSWELKQEDVYKISQIPQHRGYLAQMFVSDDAPYKSVEEFWDGEI